MMSFRRITIALTKMRGTAHIVGDESDDAAAAVCIPWDTEAYGYRSLWMNECCTIQRCSHGVVAQS